MRETLSLTHFLQRNMWHVTCDMCHENAKNISQQVFVYQKATNYQKSESFEAKLVPWAGEGGEGGGTGSIGGAWGQSWLPARQKKALWHCVRSVSLCPRCLLCHSSRCLLVFSSSTTFRRAVLFLGNTLMLELYQARLLHPSSPKSIIKTFPKAQRTRGIEWFDLFNKLWNLGQTSASRTWLTHQYSLSLLDDHCTIGYALREIGN